jgi:hypothetical protein
MAMHSFIVYRTFPSVAIIIILLTIIIIIIIFLVD